MAYLQPGDLLEPPVLISPSPAEGGTVSTEARATLRDYSIWNDYRMIREPAHKHTNTLLGKHKHTHRNSILDTNKQDRCLVVHVDLASL